jgi:hypothetical protein
MTPQLKPQYHMRKLVLTMAMAWMVCNIQAQGLQVYRKFVDSKERYGFADANGNAITPPKYGWIAQEFSEGLIAAYIPELKTVDNSNIPFAAVKTGYYWWNNYGYLDTKGKEVIAFKYEGAEPFHGGVAKVRLSNKWGLINTQGRELTPFKYDDIKESFTDVDQLVRIYEVFLNGKKQYGLLTPGGKELTAGVYDKINPFHDGVATMNRNGMLGVIGIDGKEIVPARYSNTDQYGFANGLCLVSWNNKYGYIDKTGKEVIPLVYDRLYGFNSDGTAMAIQGTGAGRIDKTGKVIVPLKYGRVEPLSDGMYSVKASTGYGWVDATGKELIAPTYGYGSSFVGGLAYVRVDKNFGAINKNNEIKIPLKYESIGRLDEGKPALYFKQGGKYGFFSETLTELAPAKYTKVYTLVQGRAYVQIDRKWGMVNDKGREIAEVKYDTLIGAPDGSVVVAVANQKIGTLSNTGEVLIPVKYDNLFGYTDGMCPVLLNNKYGYVNEAGKEVIAPQYDNISAFSNGRAQVQLGTQTFYIDKTGKKIE